MSSRSVLLLAFIFAALAAPVATAQAPAQELTVTIEGLPATVTSNGTLLAVPFTVRANVEGASPCLAVNGGTAYDIDLSARVVNSTGNSTTVRVNPVQVRMAGPVFLPAAGGDAERSEEATLLIYPGPYMGDGLNATVEVTASFAGGNAGCPGTGNTEATEATAQTRATFEPVPAGFGAGGASGNAMPGPGLVLVLVALAAVAFLARRK